MLNETVQGAANQSKRDENSPGKSRFDEGQNSDQDSIFNIEFGDIKNTIEDPKDLMSKTYQTKTKQKTTFKTTSKSTVVSRKPSQKKIKEPVKCQYHNFKG